MNTTECLDKVPAMSSDEDRQRALTSRHVQAARNRGRMTDAEADALTSATDSEARASVLQGVRARHAAERLAGAVDAGTISPTEAERLIEQVRTGGHAPGLRRLINQLARRKDEQG